MASAFDHFQGTYLWSFIAGAVFLGLFARERLNMRLENDKAAVRQQRFIELLKPSKLVRTVIFTRAWFTYVFILLFMYLTFCVTAEPIITLTLGTQFAQIGFSDVNPTSPSVPLLVSLVMTGFLGSVPLINRVEEIARRLSLRMVGIPESLNDLTDSMFDIDLDEAAFRDADIAEVKECLELAVQALGPDHVDIHTFNQSLLKINAFLHWFSRTAAWPGTNLFDQFNVIWSEIHDKSLIVQDDLNDLRERTREADDPTRYAARWRKLIQRVISTADDVCAILAIFSENAISLPGAPVLPEAGSIHERQQNAMRKFIIASRRARDESQVQFTWLISILFLTSALMFIVGALGGGLEMLYYDSIEGEQWARAAPTGVAWLLGTVVTYGPAVILSWWLRTRSNLQGNWVDYLVEERHGKFLTCIELYMPMFLLGWLASSFSLTVLFYLQAYFTSVDPTVVWTTFNKDNRALAGIAFGCLGGVYCVGMMRFFDYRELTKRSQNRKQWMAGGWLITIFLVVGLALTCLLASVLFFMVTRDPTFPNAVNEMWITTGFQAAAAAVFGGSTGVGTVFALRSLDRADQKREETQRKRLELATKLEAA